MNFYEDIAHRLYVWNTKIGDTNFANPIDFIEAKHLEAPYKGKVFYENVIKAMPNHFGAKMRNDFFNEIVQYCKNKIEGKQLILANETKGYFIHPDDLQAIFKQADYCYLKNTFSNKPLPYRNEQNEIVAKVFLPLLAYIFSCEKIPFTDFDKSKSLFNGKPFLKYYIESYQRGKSDFEKGFKLSPDTLYRNPEAYVDTIRYNYFQAKVIGTVTRTENNGWSYWKTATPLIISKEIIAEIGYYSAFIASVWELVEIHPKLFASFDKCELSTPPQQAETKTDKLKVKQIAIIHVYEGLQITRGNAGEIASKHGYTAKNSGEGLFQDYTHYCNPSNRIGKPTPCTPKRLKNKIELFESVVNHLTNSNKQRAIDEINILNTIFDNEYQ
jgi:hypothetical protein